MVLLGSAMGVLKLPGTVDHNDPWKLADSSPHPIFCSLLRVHRIQRVNYKHLIQNSCFSALFLSKLSIVFGILKQSARGTIIICFDISRKESLDSHKILFTLRGGVWMEILASTGWRSVIMLNDGISQSIGLS